MLAKHVVHYMKDTEKPFNHIIVSVNYEKDENLYFTKVSLYDNGKLTHKEIVSAGAIESKEIKFMYKFISDMQTLAPNVSVLIENNIRH